MSKFACLDNHDWKLFDNLILLAIPSDFTYLEYFPFSHLLGWISDSLESSHIELQQGVITVCVIYKLRHRQDDPRAGICIDEHYSFV